MKIQFYLKFSTQYGEQLYLSANLPELGNLKTPVLMQYLNTDYWTYTIETEGIFPQKILYKYYFKDKEGVLQQEGPDEKYVAFSPDAPKSIKVWDIWNFEGDPMNTFLTAPFSNILLPVPKNEKTKPTAQQTHIFKVKAPLLKSNEELVLLGNIQNMGAWDKQHPVSLYWQDGWWQTALNLKNETLVAYKYGIRHAATKAFIHYEIGDNRLLHAADSGESLTVVHDGFFRAHPNWKGAGVAVPVFSLRGETSLGVGEFLDIKELVNWAAVTGIQLIQLLPVNDTTDTGTFEDSYPYNAISALALHPLYLNLHALVADRKSALYRRILKASETLNNSATVMYEEVMAEKWTLIRQIFAAQKNSLPKNKKFNQFLKDNAHWLTAYAAYCFCRDKYGTSNFRLWKSNASFNAASIEKWIKPNDAHYETMLLHCFVQFHLHEQLTEAIHYARKNGVIVKGDIAIGVNRNGCDVWTEPQYFNTELQAGAPPDAFAVKGQNWGFPTYKWEVMAQDDFAWWKKRFAHMSQYFDAFRVDHILGFFRIWSIPYHATEGIMGRFVPANPVHINHFAQKGISFDYHRYCQPYITEEIILLTAATSEKATALKQYLQQDEDGTYQLKKNYTTQREVMALKLPAKDVWIKQALCNLISNVILLEDEQPDGQHFHFRFNMFETLSFQHLPNGVKHPLYTLYHAYFYSIQEELWKKQAMQILPALKRSTDMLVCGEDLGFVPQSVPYVMHQLGLLSLEIQRMPKQPGQSFFNPADAPYLSVVAASTHDMSTIRSWWEEDRANTQQFFEQVMHNPGVAPFYCEPWVNKAIVIQHLYSPAMWCILLLQDWMGIDGTIRRKDPEEERINIPANPRHYWRYRMHISLKELIAAEDCNKEIKEYIILSGRSAEA